MSESFCEWCRLRSEKGEILGSAGVKVRPPTKKGQASHRRGGGPEPSWALPVPSVPERPKQGRLDEAFWAFRLGRLREARFFSEGPVTVEMREESQGFCSPASVTETSHDKGSGCGGEALPCTCY